ncbi:MAG: GNAT family N-acetyltransferase [Terriglobia bacterium]
MLRDYKPADLQTLHEIDSACFAPGISYSLGELRAFISHPRAKTWVAVEGGEAVGFAVAQRVSAQETHVITIDVVAEMRRRGTGSELMEAVERWALQLKCRVISLETAEDNAGAQAFYARRGYQKFRLIKGYYGNGTAAWGMLKALR